MVRTRSFSYILGIVGSLQGQDKVVIIRRAAASGAVAIVGDGGKRCPGYLHLT